MRVPKEVRQGLMKLLWERADQLNWAHVSPREKSQRYGHWAEDPEVGEVLTRYMAQSQVRNYLKNSLMGGYGRARVSDETRPLRVLRVGEDARIRVRFTKPHGLLLEDGSLVAWGPASSWKSILLAVHERCFERNGIMPHGVALLGATGKYADRDTRRMIERAAKLLSITQLVWLES